MPGQAGVRRFPLYSSIRGNEAGNTVRESVSVGGLILKSVEV